MRGETVSTLEAFLVSSGGEALLADVAREVLALCGPAALVDRIARAALSAEAGVDVTEDGRVRLTDGRDQQGDAKNSRGAGVDAFAAIEVRTTGPDSRLDVLLEVAVARVDEGGMRRCCSTWIRPSRSISPEALLRAAAAPHVLASAAPAEGVAAQIAPLLQDAAIVCLFDDAPWRFVAQLLSEANLTPAPREVTLLRHALRRAGLGRGRLALADAAAAFGVSAPVGEALLPRAQCVAELYVSLQATDVAFEAPEPSPAFDFGRVGFDADTLLDMPACPGVYQFLDRDGAVIYVGKANDLRQRVGSYFVERSERRKRFPEMMVALWGLRWTETGSELAARLEEQRLIGLHDPKFNVQRLVHHRRRPQGNLVVFQPGAGAAGAVELFLLRDGRLVDRVSSDRRARGMRAVRAAIRDAYYRDAKPVTAVSRDPGVAIQTRDSAVPNHGLEDARVASPVSQDEAATPSPALSDEDAQIVATFLLERGHEVATLDLTHVAGRDDAARRVRQYLTDPSLFDDRVHHLGIRPS